MSDAAGRGVTVTEIAAMDQPIDVLRETTAAFIGRALRGPVNEPVLIHSLGEFRRRFGDVWTRSSLGPAVKQFFDHGGRNLYIVRVTNNARGAMLCIPANGSALVLRALEPGSSETIRAAVDFDGIDDADEELFNLTLQRVDPTSGLVLDQEFFHRASFRAEAENCIVDLLLTSSLARADTPLPTHRPERTSGPEVPIDSSYVLPTQAGNDGRELSDYDIVGSRLRKTGLFALDAVGHFDLLYLPPPGKHRDLGATSVLAAERYCRERGAMLIVDPPVDWRSATDAAAGVREQGFASPNLLGYFPRMYHREEDVVPPRPAGAALAGLLCKLDRNFGAWQELDQQGLGFSRDLVPAIDVDDATARALKRAGLNVIRRGPAGSARCQGSVTLGRGSETYRRFSSLPVRRLCLQVVAAIEDATRWAVFAADEASVAERVCRQASTYLETLYELGALASDRFIVECDAGLYKRAAGAGQGFAVFIAFLPAGCDAPVYFTLHQTAAGCRVGSTAFAPGHA